MNAITSAPPRATRAPARTPQAVGLQGSATTCERRAFAAGVSPETFVAGVCLVADLVDGIEAHEGTTASAIEACWRGRDPHSFGARSQEVAPALRFLRTLQQRPVLTDGAAAALMAVLGASPETPEELRRLTYTDCFGGPDTEYEDDNVAAGEEWRLPVAELMRALVRQLDGALTSDDDFMSRTEGPFAAALLRDAIESAEEALQPIGDAYTKHAKDLLAFVNDKLQGQIIGAMRMDDLSPAFRTALQCAVETVDAIVKLLDMPSDPARAAIAESTEPAVTVKVPMGTSDALFASKLLRNVMTEALAGHPGLLAVAVRSLDNVDAALQDANDPTEPPPGAAAPAASTTEGSGTAREVLAPVVATLEAYMEGLEHVGISTDSHSTLHAKVLAAHYQVLELVEGSDPLDLEVVNTAMSVMRDGLTVMLAGMDDVCPGRPIVAESIRLLLTVLNQPTVDAGTPERFMRGFRAFADVAEACFENEEAAAMWACAQDDGGRGAGVPQWRAPVVRLLAGLQSDPVALEGFASALVAYIAPTRHSSWGGDLSNFREISYEQVEGGSTAPVQPAREPDTTSPAEHKNASPWMRQALALSAVLRPDLHASAKHAPDMVALGMFHIDAMEASVRAALHATDDSTCLAAIGAADKSLGELEALFDKTKDCSDLTWGLFAGLDTTMEAATEWVTDAPIETADNRPDAERIELARSAAAFIARLVDYFQVATHPGTMGDLAALGKAASVILSALTDPVEDDASLNARLEDALESASVILRDQPPAYWKEPGILRQRDVGKRLAASAEAHW